MSLELWWFGWFDFGLLRKCQSPDIKKCLKTPQCIIDKISLTKDMFNCVHNLGFERVQKDKTRGDSGCYEEPDKEVSVSSW